MQGRDWFARHLPHCGEMSLLATVEACDEAHIVCSATSHADPANPLRHAGRLGIAAGIEYAAQAMAAHGAMLSPAGGRPRVGYLASVRGVELFASRLDQAGPLKVRADRLSGDDTTVLYAFTVEDAGACLLRGRATVVLRAEAGR